MGLALNTTAPAPLFLGNATRRDDACALFTAEAPLAF
ncbi:hypothetical protein QO010_004396 [Caulobacter ginsengisoli]|uniref:Uncharacterized protein n=1 Tax=Caulobacter ginsengisoli TaxID=400775 RepID=A0ABU0IX60_9CAUL|nr:hypothetical protein [Caulobacter ginsengisoli]